MTDRKRFHYKYSTEDDPGDLRDFYAEWDLEASRDILGENYSQTYLRFVAEDAAQTYFDDGAYDHWKYGEQTLSIFRTTGEKLGTFSVELEYTPVFYAAEVK